MNSIDPVAMSVGVGERTLDADYLVVSLGARLAPELVTGLEEAGHNLYSLEGSVAVKTSSAQSGGVCPPLVNLSNANRRSREIGHEIRIVLSVQ